MKSPPTSLSSLSPLPLPAIRIFLMPVAILYVARLRMSLSAGINGLLDHSARVLVRLQIASNDTVQQRLGATKLAERVEVPGLRGVFRGCGRQRLMWPVLFFVF